METDSLILVDDNVSSRLRLCHQLVKFENQKISACRGAARMRMLGLILVNCTRCPCKKPVLPTLPGAPETSCTWGARVGYPEHAKCLLGTQRVQRWARL